MMHRPGRYRDRVPSRAVLAVVASGLLAVASPALARRDGEGAPVKKTSAQDAKKTQAVPTPNRLSSAQLRLGDRLLARLAADHASSANVIVSPASVAVVLSLLDVGANEKMRSAIHKTIGFADKADAKRDLKDIRASSLSFVNGLRDGGPLAFANLVIFDPASQPRSQAVADLKASGTNVTTEDMSKPETIARINAWVNDQTKGLIPSILDEPSDRTGLVALNALYFKDRWKVPFDPGGTRDETFQVAAEKSMTLPLMHADGRFAFRQNDTFVAANLSYQSDGYELVIVTSKNKPLPIGEFAAVADWLGGQGFAISDGEIAMPRFSVTASQEMLPALDALGLAEARKMPGALSGLVATTQTLSRVVQKTELRVNEKGTEAAAATAATTMRSAMPSPSQYVKMIVDRPFMFALRDKRSGLLLLYGYVSEPTAMKAEDAQ